MSDRDEFGAFLVGFIVGGLSGAVVALLFAPQTGEETRALIKDKSIELRDKAQVSAEEAMTRPKPPRRTPALVPTKWPSNCANAASKWWTMPANAARALWTMSRSAARAPWKLSAAR